MIPINLLLDLVPIFVKDHLSLLTFFSILTYVLFLVHWVLSTDWEAKFNWCSLIIGLTGLFYLHYSHVVLLLDYEPFFFAVWVILLFYHASVWKSNYSKIYQALYCSSSTAVIASLKPFDGSIFRYFIVLPKMKNAAGQWNSPPFQNAIHVVLICFYTVLIILHVIPFLTPLHCILQHYDRGVSSMTTSMNCCRYNFVMDKNFHYAHSVNDNYCSGPVRIGFVGSWSTGKTSIISALLGHNYSTAQIAPAPTTDKFICLAMGASYSDPIRSDDYEMRKNCDVMSHINDITQKQCGQSQPNVLDVADVNTEFQDFVFFDTPGYQAEYLNDCTYQTFYSQLIEKMDFLYVVWDVHHGKIDDNFATFFVNKAHGRDYEMIYNRYEENRSNMAFLNQQYGKMTKGHEILSEGYILKVHENTTSTDAAAAAATTTVFHEDILLLRSKILSVNQTVHDNRKITMKETLKKYRGDITGFDSLRRIKIGDRLIQQDLNIHSQPKRGLLRHFGVEL